MNPPLSIEALFLTLAVMWLAAGLLGAAASRLGIPSVIGELTAGIVLGPTLLGWVAPDATLQALAEIGVVLLLFEVGMDTDLSRLRRSGGQSVAVALTGFALPFALGFVCAHWLFDLSLPTSLFVGGTLTATSIGITVRVFNDLGRDCAPEGQIVLGAAVLDDVLGVITLAVLAQFGSAGEVSAASVGRIVFFVLAFVVAAPLAAKLAAGLISGLLATLVAVALAGKWASGFVVRLPRLQQHAIGLAMIPRGEVGLIFVQLGVAQGLLGTSVSAALLATVAITTLLPPLALQALYGLAHADAAVAGGAAVLFFSNLIGIALGMAAASTWYGLHGPGRVPSRLLLAGSLLAAAWLPLSKGAAA